MKPCYDNNPHLEGQIVVLLFVIGPQSVPPLPQNLADCPVVLVRMPLMNQATVAFAEDHERVHWTADVVFLPLGWQTEEDRRWAVDGTATKCPLNTDCNGEFTFLSPSLGRALRDCVRLFMGPLEGTESLPIPGENLWSRCKSEFNSLEKKRGEHTKDGSRFFGNLCVLVPIYFYCY